LMEPGHREAPPGRQRREKKAQADSARAPLPGSATRTEEEAAANAMRDACHALRRKIAISKARAWQELLDSVNDDPWGRPYKMVMHKIKH